jgi:uncharacterized protein YaiL (DUF2058 family)
MSNLRDQLKKAKILSDKDARRLAHEERVHKKEIGREGIEAERAARERELETLRETERTRHAEREAALAAQRAAEAERAACLAILETEVKGVGRGAPWYFELEDGRIPFVRIDELDRHQLAGGQLCIVRRGEGDAHVYGLLATPLAKRIAQQFPRRLAWAARV